MGDKKKIVTKKQGTARTPYVCQQRRTLMSVNLFSLTDIAESCMSTSKISSKNWCHRPIGEERKKIYVKIRYKVVRTSRMQHKWEKKWRSLTKGSLVQYLEEGAKT